MARLRYSLFKATYEWLLDQGMTPYFLINADFPQVIVPREFVEDGEIVLDASVGAIEQMCFDENGISFLAGFAEGEFRIYFPIGAVIALYAEENEQGLFTTEEISTLLVQEEDTPLLTTPSPSKSTKPEIRRGHLKLVK